MDNEHIVKKESIVNCIKNDVSKLIDVINNEGPVSDWEGAQLIAIENIGQATQILTELLKAERAHG